jgi:hypothetical protein
MKFYSKSKKNDFLSGKINHIVLFGKRNIPCPIDELLLHKKEVLINIHCHYFKKIKHLTEEEITKAGYDNEEDLINDIFWIKNKQVYRGNEYVTIVKFSLLCEEQKQLKTRKQKLFRKRIQVQTRC